MEVEEIETQAYNFSRIGNGRIDYSKISLKDPYPDYKEDGDLLQQLLKRASANSTGGLSGDNSRANGLRGWDHSSGIIRVSSVSGGKVVHSKVFTSKGLRDRRVRLSVTTAIQFYDLQDRLGYDRPSKAVEWLIKVAAATIPELPPLNSSVPDTPKQLSEEKSASEGTDAQGFVSVEVDGEPNYQQNQSQDLSLLKSACGSNSETSKGLGFSQGTSPTGSSQPNEEPNFFHEATTARPGPTGTPMEYFDPGLLGLGFSQGTSPTGSSQPNEETNFFHEGTTSSPGPTATPMDYFDPGLLGLGFSQGTSLTGSSQPNEEPNFFHEATAASPWPATTPMDYFDPGLLGPSSSRLHHFSGQIQLGNSNSIPQAMPIPPFSVYNENHEEMQHFSFVPDHLIPVTAAQPWSAGDYNLNFTISSGLAGFNRVTRHSNSSPSLLPHLQSFGSSSPIDGPNVPFFIVTTPEVENHQHHHFPAGFDGHLQLFFGDGSRHFDQKGKGKN